MATEKRASLIIELKDQASKALTGLRGGIDKLRQSWLTVTAAVAGVVAISLHAVRAFAEEENAINKRNQAMKNMGVYSEELSKRMNEEASAIQRVTAVSDEAVIGAQGMLTSFGLVGEKMSMATKAALDLSAGLDIDLKTAALLVGKAFTGETATLSRYGIQIQDGASKSEKFAQALDQINERFGGQAEAKLSTYSGRIENLTNRLGDLQERLGKELLPVLESWSRVFDSLLQKLEKFNGAQLNDLSVKEITIAKLKEERAEIIEQAKARAAAIGGVVRLSEEEQARVVMITRQINATRESMAADTEAADAAILAAQNKREALSAIDAEADAKKAEQREKDRLATIEDFEQSLFDLQVREDKRAGIENAAEKRRAKLLADRLKLHGETTKAEILLEKMAQDDIAEYQIKMDEEEKKRREEMTKNFQSTMQFISTLATSKNRTLAAIGKAAAITSATMDTYAAANKALASAPPPYNFALAALVTAAGLANVAKISGVQLAEGGIVMPRPGGTQAVIGEAGSPEAVIPLNNPMARDMLGGGGAPQITFEQCTFVGSGGVRELVEIIDKELYSMRRNNESVAFGGNG